MIEFFSHYRAKTIYVLLLLALTLPSRLTRIDAAVNIDEPWWVISSSNFYYAVAHRDFADTYFEYHPGVTNMWVISTAMLAYFPEYRGFGQGFFDQRKPFFEEFLRENGRETIELVRYARMIQAGVLAVFAVAAFLLLSLIVGENLAFLSIALATVSPFFLGHSRLLNMETMGAMFVLVSLLGFFLHRRQNRLIHLLISGAAFGLAQLNKSTSVALLGAIGLMLLLSLFEKNKKPFKTKLLSAITTFGMWFGAAALVYFILWPGMWVDPARMLREVYGNAFSYAFQGARLDVTEELDPASFSLVARWDGILLYLRYWLSGTTFITWLGVILALVFLFTKEKERLPALIRSLVGYLSLLGVLFILMFGVAQGRNHAHYIMNAFVCLDVVAGIGWGSAVAWAASRWTGFSNPFAPVAASVVLILAQIGFGLPYAPYYFTYRNPLAKEAATLGYGEGLAEAAEYLSQKPDAQEITAYVYNGMGTFSWYFPGETIVLKRANILNDDFVTITDELRESDYLVLYPITRAKHPETGKMLSEFEGVVEPEKTIYINGLEYIQIYRVADIPESVYQALLAKRAP
ncbi:MAG: glycosyltransferase family 39 protein [Anaerolineales bacterium]|nr:glycosyltransferase family 39 protein [Anaerolineales bacterium]